MLTNKGKICFVIAVSMLFVSANVYAAEFSTDKILTEAQRERISHEAVQQQENNTQTCINCNDNKDGEKQIPLLAIKDVQENPSGKITVTYKDIPVTVPASKVTNVIKVPYLIKNLGSSKFCPDKMVSPNCIPPDNIGKSEHQISVVPVAGRDTDFAIATEGKTFIITLRPVLDTPAYIEIKDEGSNTVNNTVNTAKAENFEKSFPYVEGLLEIIKKAVRNEQIEGYITKYILTIHETPDLYFIIRKEMIGARYKVVYIDILNRTNSVIQLREDSELLQNVVANIAGSPLASTLSREFLQPNAPETERKGEHISTLISVVRRSASDR
jgi:ribosomal protein S17E